MRNSPYLPLAALILAIVLGLHAGISAAATTSEVLNELQLGEIAIALTLAIYAVQGLISVLVEGQELKPGRVRPRLTGLLSVGILSLSLVLFGLSIMLAYGIADDWRIEAIGTLAGIGCIVLSILLVLYKEAFIGDEANFDDRRDGVPW